MREMNPMPALQTVGLCGKLQEVTVWEAKHCEVGIYEMCIQMNVVCVFTQCA